MTKCSVLSLILASSAMAGEWPRVDAAAGSTYQQWIESGAMEAVAKVLPEGKGYVIEWAMRFHPCLEVAPDRFFEFSRNSFLAGGTFPSAGKNMDSRTGRLPSLEKALEIKALSLPPPGAASGGQDPARREAKAINVGPRFWPAALEAPGKSPAPTRV